MKVYVVEGMWEDEGNFIHGIYATQEKAEAVLEVLIQEDAYDDCRMREYGVDA